MPTPEVWGSPGFRGGQLKVWGLIFAFRDMATLLPCSCAILGVSQNRGNAQMCLFTKRYLQKGGAQKDEAKPKKGIPTMARPIRPEDGPQFCHHRRGGDLRGQGLHRPASSWWWFSCGPPPHGTAKKMPKLTEKSWPLSYECHWATASSTNFCGFTLLGWGGGGQIDIFRLVALP